MLYDDSISTLFEGVVSQNPDAVAMVWDGGSLTYHELNRRANRLAHLIIKEGIKPEAAVGVFSQRSPATLIAFLAIIKASGAYVPLDPVYPTERVQFYLQDADIQLILADPAEKSRFPATGAKVLNLELDPAVDLPETNPAVATGPGSLANILFTSGSTGTPKGTLIEHRGIMRLVRSADYVEIQPADVFLQFAPLGFDASTFEIWAPWLNGATLAVSSGQNSLRDLAVALEQFNVTTLWLTAGLFRLVVEQQLESLAGVRQLLTGGDVVSPEHAATFLKRFPHTRLINGYGPTENTVFTACGRITLEQPMPERLGIGRPIRGTGVLIVDEQLRAVAHGELGEIVATGDGLARGYLNQASLTQQAFVEVTDASGHKFRAYRTGDLGVYNADGTLDFRGRRDDQVKINGIRIEPGELRSVLESHSQVAAAEVVVAGESGQKRLETFVVKKNNAQVDERTLRDYLGEKIPASWRPSTIHFVPEFPLTSNGKVDRKALLTTLGDASSSVEDATWEKDAPDDATEKVIWAVWREMLPGRRITRDDVFADLGGDSLSALAMIARVEKALDRQIGLRPMLEAGTIKAIAAAAHELGPFRPPPLMGQTQKGTETKPPFFFAHGDYVCGGLYCQRLAPQLGVDQPFYALAPHGTFGGDLPPNYDAIGASYMAWMRTVQPHGPYYLGGFCNGAVAAYETARQLITAGEKIGALVLFDPPDFYLFYVRKRITDIATRLGVPERLRRPIAQRLAEGIEMWKYHGFFNGFVKSACIRLGRWIWKMLGRLAGGRPAVSAPAQQEDAAAPPDLDFFYYELIANYQPEVYPARSPVWVILREKEKRRGQQVTDWKRLTPGARFEAVSGAHLDLQAGLPAIAQAIRISLNESAAESAGSAGKR